MVANNKNLYQKIKDIVEEIVSRKVIQPFQLYVVTDSKKDSYKVNIRSLNNPSVQYDDVAVTGIGLGNFKGIINLPVKDDVVLVAFISKNNPIVLGNIFANQLATITGPQSDVVPAINVEELLITNKGKGASIHMKESNKIVFNKGSRPIARLGDKIEVEVIWSDPAGSGVFEGTITSGNNNILSD